MLAAAGGTKSTVTRLENAQLNKWKEEGKKADDIYRLLRIDAEGSNLLKSPKLQMWMAYMSKLDKDPYDFLLFKVKANYDDAGLAKMLVLAKSNRGTRAIARKLETLQLESWMKNDKTMIDAFQLLKLNEEGTTLLKSPVLTTWVSYVEMLEKDPYELLFLAIKKNGFDEVNLAKMIGAAKQDIHTGSIAAKMEDLQFQKWSKDGKSSEDLFKFLGLNKEGDKLFDSPAWSIWASYLNRQEMYPELVMFSILRTRFGDEKLSKMVTRAKEADSTKEVAEKLQLEIWRANGQTSDEIFNLLKLNEKKDKILESPALSTWVDYVRRLDSVKERKDNFVLITQLEKYYCSEDLARMLASSKSASKEGIIDDLQELQFEKWMAQKKDPSAVDAMFPSSDLASFQVKLDFKKFYKENIDG
ncbi:hypothetical protein Pcac1_g26640 [Phytophthora cactorum]|uniref:RXLR phytopathogen effector protein WY-domain domain-containing protein n=3 Tax=Phytophthora cactorum TaxID=29920 RepID=A0A329SJ42_9STRA|nr:hypothetical protein Pcac1_g26640 [Phytophthora cactorum]RAW36847.1 hypothetical protein PC110_g6888 [Phytophthora cactorum]